MELLEARETRVGVLDKAMSILSAYSRGDLALSPLEIATRTGLPLPTVYRLAQALSEHGLLMKDGQRFRLGMTLLRMGMLVAEGIAHFDVDQSFDPHQFYAELEHVRTVGWAASDGERVSGVSALAAPVFDAAGHVAAALTLVAPLARLSDEQRARYMPLVCEAARRTSRDLGYVQRD